MQAKLSISKRRKTSKLDVLYILCSYHLNKSLIVLLISRAENKSFSFSNQFRAVSRSVFGPRIGTILVQFCGTRKKNWTRIARFSFCFSEREIRTKRVSTRTITIYTGEISWFPSSNTGFYRQSTTNVVDMVSRSVYLPLPYNSIHTRCLLRSTAPQLKLLVRLFKNWSRIVLILGPNTARKTADNWLKNEKMCSRS